ncbi:MAG: cytochrome c biogenesis CcdA family protein [Trueperaceae bacterium]
MTPTLPLAFLAGVLSFLSPCVLPLVPSYLAYIGGSGLSNEGKSLRAVALRNSLLFILGFSLIFIALGVGSSILGTFLRTYKAQLSMIGGVVVILFGLIMLGLFKLPLFYRDTRFQFKGDSSTPWGALLMGMAFAAGWTPCIGPILGGILTLSATSETMNQGILLLAVYALGLGVPFFLAALATERFLNFSKRFRQHLPWVERGAGALLVVVGMLMVTGYATELNQFFLRLTPEWLSERL